MLRVHNELVLSPPVANETQTSKSQSRLEEGVSWQCPIARNAKMPTVTRNLESPFIAKRRQPRIQVAVSFPGSQSKSRGHRGHDTTGPGHEGCWRLPGWD